MQLENHHLKDLAEKAENKVPPNRQVKKNRHRANCVQMRCGKGA